MKLRKPLSIILALSMLLAFCIPAFADTGTPAKPDAAVAALGGTPGRINVIVNEGPCISFPDAVPELRSNRTMVPMRAAMESIGATVDYDAETRTAIVESEAVSFRHVIGTDLITLKDGSTVRMDVSSYIQQGRTMVPLRFFSQVLGYSVQWDGEHRMVFLLDEAYWAEKIDGNCTLLNAWVKNLPSSDWDPAKNLKFTSAMTGKLTDGTEALPFSMNAEAVLGKKGLSASFSGDLGQLSDVLSAVLSQQAGKQIPVDPAFKGELRFGEGLYLTSSVTDTLFQTVRGLQKNPVWIHSDADLPAFNTTASSRDNGDATFGQRVFRAMTAQQSNSFFTDWEALCTAAQNIPLVFGDASVRRSGSDLLVHVDPKSLMQQLGLSSAEMSGIDADLFTMDLTLHADGGIKLSLKLSVPDTGAGASTLLFELEAHTDDTLTYSLTGTFPQGLSLLLSGSCKVEQTTEEPVTAAPTGNLYLVTVDPSARNNG